MEEESNNQQRHTFISSDIWFHLANYIAPEDVQRYSLICTQSSKSINSCTFLLQMYRRWCQHSPGDTRKWNLLLPENLQMQCIKGCDRNTLRQKVIQALFYCYPYFKLHLRTPYKLETLTGRAYVSSWYQRVKCVWIMCYKFKIIFPTTNAAKCQPIDILCHENNMEIEAVVDNWECLAEEENNNLCNIKSSNSISNYNSTATNDMDGISILVIYCDRFFPFPSDIIYNHTTNPFRLAATRKLLSADMRSINLELDFISATGNQTTTVRYTKIKKFKVLPWWHPDFRIFNKCK